MQTRSKVEVFLHFVWATKGRVPITTESLERAVHRCIAAEATRLGCEIIALNGMPDHVHMLVNIPGSLSPAVIAKQVKGVSSNMLNDLREEHSEPFRWQDGYACFSIWRSQVDRVAEYVRNQKQHHAAGAIWPEWEETYEPAPVKPPEDRA